MPHKSPFVFAFDIGHSSIGWSVMEKQTEPALLGTGVVTFPADDCLASERRTFRRQRRNIRSRRQRIQHMAMLFHHMGVLTEEQTSGSGNSAPFLDAAEVLNNLKTLTWSELWNVLRWYAHNRGYDGNRRWKTGGDEESEDDSRKVENAHHLMRQHGTETMVETITSALGIQFGTIRRSSHKGYKTLDIAFPRDVVEQEVREILQRHVGVLDGLTHEVINTLITPLGSDGKTAWNTIPVPGIELPRRYKGGLLFGQLVPRFDNRIIARCPISGEKVPNKAGMDFYRFRWAMIVANIRVESRALSISEREKINDAMKASGKLTKSELIKTVEEVTGSNDHNLSTYFELHPDSDKALVLDPALAKFHSGERKNTNLYPYWQKLPEAVRLNALNKWKKGRVITLDWMLHQCEKLNADANDLGQLAEKLWLKDQTSKKPKFLTKDHFMKQGFSVDAPSGRAPYSKSIMKKAVDFVFSTDRHPAEKGGPLERTKEVLQQEEDRSIDELTNNHLVRHRLKILEKLTQDMIDSYADGDAGRVDTVVVEVATELKEFSGKKAKEIKAEIEGKLKHFQTAVTHLEKEGVSNINGSLIRKCRIAMDQNWTCPFTGQQFDAHDLSYMEREHIIPRSIMQTDAMYALVLTFPEVNRMKGKRTALRFIEENQGAIVSERENLSILTSRGYKALVDKLSTKGHPQDTARMRKRKQLLMVMDMDSRETGFTEGSLTQTSHLVRLSARQLCKNLPAIQPHDVISFPGQVTAVVRKAWDLTGCLDAPNVCGDETKGKTKTEIRSITHLHHAVDAITLAYASHYFPKNTSWNGAMQPGALWRAMVARNPNQEQAHLLKSSPLFRLRKSRNGSNRFEVEDIPQALKKQATQRLSEKRVVQHIPADMHGVEAEQNTWRVLNIEGDPSDLSTEVTLRQHTVTDVKNGIRIRKCKTVTEKAGKLLGLLPKSGKGKLKDLKGALVIKTNYGLSLDPEPTIIPFHKVWHRIQELKACNDGKHPRILRRGQIIKIQGYNSKRDGIWKIHSVKASLTVDLARPELTKVKSKGNGSWREVSINSLLQKQCLYFTINNLTGTQM